MTATLSPTADPAWVRSPTTTDAHSPIGERGLSCSRSAVGSLLPHVSLAEANDDHARRRVDGDVVNHRPCPPYGDMGECPRCGSTLMMLSEDGAHMLDAADAGEEAWELHMATVLELPTPFELGEAGC